jgi:hypothetical protein
MAEDSGAFKTNQANSRQVPAFVMIPARRCREASLVRKRHSQRGKSIQPADF